MSAHASASTSSSNTAPAPTPAHARPSTHPSPAIARPVGARTSALSSANPSRQGSPVAPNSTSSGAATATPNAAAAPNSTAFRPLNVRDALAYLDRVKQQFSAEYTVYDQFLTIMKEFKTQAIDTPGVIDRVSTLFRGHPSLIQGFNTFLPPGYRIECIVSGAGNDAGAASNTITVTTPQGTTTRTQDVAGIEAREFVNAGGAATPQGNGSASPLTVGKLASAIEPTSHVSAAALAAPSAASTSMATSNKPSASTSTLNPGNPTSRIISPPAPIPPFNGGKSANAQAGSSGSWQAQQQQQPPPTAPKSVRPAQNAPSGRQSKRDDDDPKGKAVDANGDSAMSSAQPPPPSAGPPAQPALAAQAPTVVPGAGAQPQLEFNHAINYVNKIKNRFTKDPDTYKTFLEILQTYQKEMKPIQEVYTQVTALFHTAPDLLDEFKAFLPDTSEAGNAAVAPGGPAPPPVAQPTSKKSKDGSQQRSADAGSSREDGRSGLGSKKGAFAEEKKKRAAAGGSGEKTKVKRTKTHHVDSPPVTEAPPPKVDRIERTSAMTSQSQAGPPVGEPLQGPPMYHPQPYGAPPANFPGAVRSRSAYEAYLAGHRTPQLVQADEFSFFDRVKKHIDDRTSYTDFLKLLNLFTQEIIDTKTLLEKALIFIGTSDELFAQFKELCGWNPVSDGRIEGEDWIIDNEPAWKRPPVDLRETIEYGPSYRRLPESEIDLACSARGPLEWSVLNDEWVAWATSQSEGSNAHRKNPYEETMYYAEQERHWYSWHIESNLRTIAHFEPIAARIARMTSEERNAFRLDGLGGTAPSVYERIIRKIWGKEHWHEIVHSLCENPAQTVPLVLARLKQKDEEWKRAEREWNRVWREVDLKNYYRALDHQGILFKALDKKATMTSKALTNEVEALRRDRTQKRTDLDSDVVLRPLHQFVFGMTDRDVLFDVIKLTFSYLDREQSGYSVPERARLEAFVRLFIPLLFDIPQAEMDANLAPQDESQDAPGDDDDIESEADGENDKDASSGSSLNKRNGVNKKGGAADLRKRLLKHVASSSRQKAGSRPGSPNGFDDLLGSLPPGTLGEQKWIQLSSESEADAEAEAPSSPRRYNFFANACFYCLIRMLHTVYHRLLAFKQLANELSKKEQAFRLNPLAVDLGLAHPMPIIDEGPNPAEHYYDHLLDLAEKLFEGDIDQQTYEEQLRFMASIKAYPLYTLDKLIGGVIKHVHVANSDAKSQDLTALLEKDRAGSYSTARQMIAYRNEAEAIIGSDDNLYRIEWIPESQALTIQLLGREDLTLDDSDDPLEYQLHRSWIASYPLTSATEGVGAKVKAPLLKRNRMLSASEDPQEFDLLPGLEAKIVAGNYQLKFVAGTEDYLYRKRPVTRTPTPPPAVAAATPNGTGETNGDAVEGQVAEGSTSETVDEGTLSLQKRRVARFERWLEAKHAKRAPAAESSGEPAVQSQGTAMEE
ncbi:BZ3500_MvSof-1268-A1-R1_Chr3-1g05689 [Microbotryum saponariae]|uniref:BZ3500_MvSof-1268-A1-R1_Chr3-1g05689 protein n=1 Tax=Microbotryum saponariae TaxID=289078 RepID=A0A2X0LGA5_9BASI|nr:BZ3500_MvSof-1268-A1-R1_Chr3-1g05689 [Microbotryum saponariae]SDA04879.1 BZ3501_MvSof-1269-A2-R1_Chr3-1g05359 [Microbotryum saponariae]